MKMKKIVALLLVFVMSLSLAACGSTSNQSTSPDTPSDTTADTPAPAQTKVFTDKVVIGINDDTGTLNPFGSFGSAISSSLSAEIFEYLFTSEGSSGEMVGELAIGYEQTKSNEFEITIYDYIYDTAGNHITAEDVVYSYKAYSKVNTSLSTMKKISATGDYTIRLVMKSDEPEYGDLEKLLKSCPIVSQAAYEASTDDMVYSPVGTGPYKCIDYVPNSSMTLEATGNYWQKPELTPQAKQQNIKYIEYKYISEANQHALALKTGDLDYSEGVVVEDLRTMLGDSSFTIGNIVKGTSDTLVFCGYEGSVFTDNKALRQAICYAIDAQGLVNVVYGGNEYGEICNAPGTGAINTFPDYVSAWDNNSYFEYNVEKAKELLKEAGYPNGGLTIRLMVTTSYSSMAQMIQGYLDEIGITVEILTYENTLFNTYRQQAGQWDMYISALGSADPSLLAAWKMSFDARKWGGITLNGYADDELQARLEAAAAADTHSDETMTAFAQYLSENPYMYSMCMNYTAYVMSSSMSDIARNAKNVIMPGGCNYVF